MRNIILLVFLFVYSNSIEAQSFANRFKHISTSEGLSQSSAIAIHQDHLGQIWIGTRDGLNKYDGSRFTVYRYNADENSLSSSDILSIEEDHEEHIWVGTYNGLNKYNPRTNTFENYYHSNQENSLIHNVVLTIKTMANGEVWVGTEKGVSIYDEQTNSFKNIKTSKNDSSSLQGTKVLSILEKKDGSIFVGTSKGIFKLLDRANDTFRFKNLSTSYGGSLKVQDVIEGTNNNLLIATKNQKVLELNLKTENIAPYISESNQAEIYKDIRKLAFDNANNLWIGTYKGLSIIDVEGNVTTLRNTISNTNSLSKNSVKSIYKDNKGSMWVGTYYGGVNFWDQTNVNFINYARNIDGTSLGYNVVSSIESDNEHVFFGTEGGGVSVQNLATNSFQYLRSSTHKGLLDDNIKALKLLNNRLWLGTYNKGIAVYNLDTKAFENSILKKELVTLLEDVGVYSIQFSTNTFWFGTFGKGIVKYNITSGEIEHYLHDEDNVSKSISSNLIRGLYIDSQNNLWAGTERGLNKISPDGAIQHFFYNEKIQLGDDIATVYEDAKKQIWAGTKAKGLYKLNGGAFEKVDLFIENETVSAIHSILDGGENMLWISTNQGLIRYDYETNEQIVYNEKDGLVGNEFNDNSSMKIGGSTFYFGGPSGVTSFDTSNLNSNNYSPQVIITDFKVKNERVEVLDENEILTESIAYTKSLELGHQQGNFSIDFSIPNFINANNNLYKYRLRGLEDEWVVTSQNSASYTIQNPGEYIFEVRGANNDGVWNTDATELVIYVHPAPWRSWWAFLIYGVVIIVALLFLMSILKSRTKLKHQLELEHLETERANEINKAKLEFFTNISHEFRTPLTLILGPLHQVLENYKGSSTMYKKLLVIESSANHLLQLINRLMDFRKLEKKQLKLEAAEGNIVKFLKEIYLSFSEYANDGGYEYTFTTSNEVLAVYYDRVKLERVFYNLISNAFRYTPKGGKIAVEISISEGEIYIVVKDSGVGIADKYKHKIFERFFEVSINNQPDGSYSKGTGIGLSIAKSIVDLHRGSIDVYDNEETTGTVFKVALPLGRAHLSDDEVIENFVFSDDISQYVNQLDTQEVVFEDEFEDRINSEDKQKVLIVEDNKALRSFLHNILKERYNILEAENGKVALGIVRKEMPDLVLSDVIMPVMVGTDLCAEMKKDPKTSHIPVILLTSRTSLVYRIEGLGYGADDYISKPFDVNELMVRVKNLLEATSRLKAKFTSEDTIVSTEKNITSQDEELYKKAIQIVHENISNDHFDIPTFCEELGVSRTMLFLKIKEWTECTPNEFIQHFRMKRAAELLEQGKINISEVSYKVGFKNPKYFSKCFHKKYGETPSQYSEKFSTF